MSQSILNGVLPVLQTPFSSDGAIDAPALVREVDWVLEQGVAGVTTGMVSELLRLTADERCRLTELVVAAVAGRGLTVISCGAESTHTSVELAQHAAAAGATAVMVNPPLSSAATDQELAGHFTAIIESVELPVVVQDASGYVGRPLSLELQLSLLDQHPEQLYFKPEASPIGQRLSQLRDLTGGRARILEGTGGAALLDSYRRGIVGTMPGAEVCWGVQRLWECLQADEWEQAYRLSGILNMMIGMQESLDAFVAVEKHLLVRQGVFANTAVRGPASFVLDAETAAEIDRLADQLKVAAGARG